ncbi:non-ribosomal peptide synthetase, partial [Sansalvadorimonas verongulae]|nr:non-ribosomal peptide synthetase [Sansalvadorimonas verongulae]
MGQVATQSYIEFDLDDIRQLDISCLEQAWQGLIARHPMLRAVILPSGQQQVLDDVPAYSIAVTDLQALDDTTLATRLASIRHTESHRVSDPGTWPLFDCQLLQLPGQKGRLLLRIDALIMDAGSIFLLFAELMERYQHPDKTWLPLTFTFRDYLLAIPDDHPARLRDQTYWLDRLDNLPPAPQLPRLSLSSEEPPRFVRRTLSL